MICVKVHADLGQPRRKVIEGRGRIVVVPDRYFKSGPADTTAICATPGTSGGADSVFLPTWANVVHDTNRELHYYPHAAANIVMNTPEDLGTSAYHLASIFTDVMCGSSFNFKCR